MNGSEIPLARALRGPVTLITLGILFALNNFTPYGFNQTWPVLLIVFGLLSLLGRGATPPSGPQPTYPPRNWNYTPPAPPPDPRAPSSYRDSSYTGSATPRPAPGPASKPGESA